MDKYLLVSTIMMVICFVAGVVAAFPTESRERLMAKGAVAVYEHRAVCEKALDQWVCSIPKE